MYKIQYIRVFIYGNMTHIEKPYKRLRNYVTKHIKTWRNEYMYCVKIHYTGFNMILCYYLTICQLYDSFGLLKPRGGHLGIEGGAYARHQNLKIPLKHWFLAQKAPLFKWKRWLFPVNKHSFFHQNTDIGWTGTPILTLHCIILCLFSGSKWRQRTRKPSHFGSHSALEPRIFRGL